MRPALLPAVLAAIALPALAEWEFVARSPSGAAYIDRPSVEVEPPDGRVVVEMYDLAQPRERDGYVFRSFLVTSRYDCVERSGWTVNFIAFAEPMGGGEVIAASDAVSAPTPVEPGSIAERVLETVCARR